MRQVKRTAVSRRQYIKDNWNDIMAQIEAGARLVSIAKVHGIPTNSLLYWFAKEKVVNPRTGIPYAPSVLARMGSRETTTASAKELLDKLPPDVKAADAVWDAILRQIEGLKMENRGLKAQVKVLQGDLGQIMSEKKSLETKIQSEKDQRARAALALSSD